MKSSLSKTAIRTIWLLIVGVLTLLIASLFNYGIYIGTISRQPSKWQVTRGIERVIKASQLLSIDKKSLFILNGKGYTVAIVNRPPPQSTMIQHYDRKSLLAKITKDYPHNNYSVMLPYGGWLVVRSHVANDSWMMGFWVIAVLFLLMLISLCYWSIRRVTMPIANFITAVERFGRDIQAPAMLVSGNAESQELQQTFNAMQSRIRRLVTDRTQMLAAISHDLRTPITRLQLRAEYLQGTDQYDKAVKDLNEIEQMIRSILSFARDYTADEVMEKFDMNALLESIANDMVDSAKPVHFMSDQSPRPYFGRVNALRRAINNIVENGVKYGERVEITLEDKGDSLIVAVIDAGEGLPEGEFDRVFAPFYRTDTARSPQQAGSGLGLAVARDIVRAHGGEIRLNNRTEGHGLVVSMTLPTS